MGASQLPYALGQDDAEHQRLIVQSRFYGDLTDALFRDAGIVPGMRVLDVGCGVGDVSLGVARLVGPLGAVVGIDRDAEPLAVARARAAAAKLPQVRFERGHVADFRADRPFDAVVGRLILVYLPDLTRTLASLARAVRPGGVVVFQEMVMSLAQSVPKLPLPTAGFDWICETLHRAGLDIDLGLNLHRVFVDAGLPPPRLHLAGRLEGTADSAGFDLVAGVARSLLPAMERHGVATAAEVGIDTLAARMREEVVAAGGVLMPPPMVGAWTRLPD